MTGKKTVISSNDELGDFLKKKGFLKSGTLLKNWYVLSNENLTVLVDTIRPRIVQIFSHGSLSTYQMLLYNPRGDLEMGNGLWGILPAAHIGVRRGQMGPARMVRYLPFPHGGDPESQASLSTNFPGEISFNPEKNILLMKSVKLHSEEYTIMASVFKVELNDNCLKVYVEYPTDVWRTEVLSQWYPLYQRYLDENEKTEGLLNYEADFRALVGNKITLIDNQGRMPRVSITSTKQVLQVSSTRDHEMSDAFKLEISAVGKVKADEVCFEFSPNPVTLYVNPQINANSEEPIAIFAEEKPELFIDDKEINIPLEKREDGRWKGVINIEHGKHSIVARDSLNNKSSREVFSFGDPTADIIKSANALLAVRFEKPELEGLFPTRYWIDTLEPSLEGSEGGAFAVCGSYQPRVAYLLAAASILTKDRKYVAAALEMLESMAKKSHILEDGSILTPPDLYEDGSPYAKMYFSSSKFASDQINDCVRPLNVSEYLKAGLFAYRAFSFFNDKESARKSLEYAARYTGTLIHMQQPDGSIVERYMYYNLKVTYPKPFPVPLFIEVFTLADLMDREGIKVIGSEKLRECIKKQIAYLDSQSGSLFNTLAGSEAMPNSLSWLSALCEGFLIRKIIFPEDKKLESKIEESFRLALMLSHCYIDAPLYYLAEACADAHYPPGKMSMSDYQTSHIGLAVKKYAGGDLGDIGRLVADYSWGDRLGDMILENGAICPWEINVPGYFYRIKDTSTSDCEAASHGLMSYHYATGEILI